MYPNGIVPYSKKVIKEFVKKGWWKNLTMGDLLDISATSSPDKVAIIDGAKRITFTQLREEVDRFAIALLGLGIKKNDIIIIQLPNRYEFAVVYYAMQKIGAIPLLMVPRHGKREVTHFLNLSGAVGWILPVQDTKHNYLSLLYKVQSESKSLKHLMMIEDGEALPTGALSIKKLIEGVHLNDFSKDYLNRFRPDPNDVCQIMPTGGTTGQPKGVPFTHNRHVFGIMHANHYYANSDIYLLTTPIGHTMGGQGGLHGVTLKGSTLVLVKSFGVKEILEAIESRRVTAMKLVPTQLNDILNYPDLAKYDLHSLRVVSTSAAPLPPDLGAQAMDFFDKLGCNFMGSAYGVTEAIVPTKNASNDSREKNLTTVGCLSNADGTHMKAIDQDERTVSPKDEGELAIKGPGVFTGYYKATPAENRRLFTHDGYFRLGDVGRITREGYIIITGRQKDVIMRGGEGITPSEIENMLRLHPNIIDVAVVGMSDPRLGERACAFVVPRPGTTLNFDEMVAFLKDQGASVLLLPERLEIISELPRTNIGKTDKKALRTDIEQKLQKEKLL